MGVSLTPVKLSPHSPLNGHTKTGFILQSRCQTHGAGTPPATRHFSQAQQSRKNSSRPWRCANRGSSGARQTFVVKVKFRFSPEKKWRNCLWIWVHQSSRFETKVLHKKNRKFYDLHPSSPILNVFICIGFSENRVYPKTWWLIIISEHSNGHK